MVLWWKRWCPTTNVRQSEVHKTTGQTYKAHKVFNATKKKLDAQQIQDEDVFSDWRRFTSQL